MGKIPWCFLALLAGCSEPSVALPTDGAAPPDGPLDASEASVDVVAETTVVDVPVEPPPPPPDADDGCLRRPADCGPSAGVLRLGERVCGDTYYGEDSHDGCGRMPPSGFPAQAWRFDAPATGRFTISATPGTNAMARDGWTVALGIVPSSCNDMVCLGYARATEAGRVVSVSFDAVAGQTYFFYVGKGNGPGNYGPYTLSVRAQ
jgi:hypothetical protein